MKQIIFNWAKRNRYNWVFRGLIQFGENCMVKYGGVKIVGKRYGRICRNVRGNNNIVCIGKDSYLNGLVIYIRGDNNKLIIGDNVRVIGKNCSIWMEGNDIEIKIGSHTSLNHTCHFCIQEDGMSLKVGENCMFANNITIRTSDAHGIYDLLGNERINLPMPVSIGNHVWIAPKTLILKGVSIGSGSIIGSNSVVTKNIPENCLAVGQPAKVVKENIRWTKERKIYDNTISINKQKSV